MLPSAPQGAPTEGRSTAEQRQIMPPPPWGPRGPLSPHSPHPSTPASCRGRPPASTRKGKQRPESPESRGRGPRGWETSGSMVGPQLAGHLYGERPGLDWPRLPAGFDSSRSLTRSPCSRIGFQETKLGSDWLPRSSLTRASAPPTPSDTSAGMVPSSRNPLTPAPRLGAAAAHRVLGRREAHTGAPGGRYRSASHSRAGQAALGSPRPIPWEQGEPERLPSPASTSGRPGSLHQERCGESLLPAASWAVTLLREAVPPPPPGSPLGQSPLCPHVRPVPAHWGREMRVLGPGGLERFRDQGCGRYTPALSSRHPHPAPRPEDPRRERRRGSGDGAACPRGHVHLPIATPSLGLGSPVSGEQDRCWGLGGSGCG